MSVNIQQYAELRHALSSEQPRQYTEGELRLLIDGIFAEGAEISAFLGDDERKKTVENTPFYQDRSFYDKSLAAASSFEGKTSAGKMFESLLLRQGIGKYRRSGNVKEDLANPFRGTARNDRGGYINVPTNFATVQGHLKVAIHQMAGIIERKHNELPLTPRSSEAIESAYANRLCLDGPIRSACAELDDGVLYQNIIYQDTLKRVEQLAKGEDVTKTRYVEASANVNYTPNRDLEALSAMSDVMSGQEVFKQTKNIRYSDRPSTLTPDDYTRAGSINPEYLIYRSVVNTERNKTRVTASEMANIEQSIEKGSGSAGNRLDNRRGSGSDRQLL